MSEFFICLSFLYCCSTKRYKRKHAQLTQSTRNFEKFFFLEKKRPFRCTKKVSLVDLAVLGVEMGQRRVPFGASSQARKMRVYRQNRILGVIFFTLPKHAVQEKSNVTFLGREKEKKIRTDS